MIIDLITLTEINALRLINGSGSHIGRIEVLINGTWGTVCDDLWDLEDASVVCQQLGYPGAREAYRASAFGEGHDPIWLDNVQCVGNESSIDECIHNPFGDNNCGHNEDAGVECTLNESNGEYTISFAFLIVKIDSSVKGEN